MVCETETCISTGWSRNRAEISDDLPAPLGAETINRFPRAVMSCISDVGTIGARLAQIGRVKD